MAGALALQGCSAGDAPAPSNAPRTSSPSAATAALPPPAGTGTGTADGASGSAPSPSATPPAPAPVHVPPAPVVGVSTLPPVPVRSPASFGNGLVAVVTSTDPVQLSASGPGEVAGPGVAVHLTLRNGSTAPIDLGGITVTASYGGGTPAPGSDAAPAAPATGVLAPGATAQGVWVFSVPSAARASLVVDVGSTSSSDVVVIHS